MPTSGVGSRKARRLVMVGVLVLSAVMAWSTFGLLGTASAQEGEDPGAAPLDDPWYAKFDGVDGSADRRGHEGWVNASIVSLGGHKAGGGATGVSRVGGKMHLEDVSIGILSDKAMPKLLEGATKGKVFSKVEIHGTATYGDAGEQVYLAVELENVQITSYQFAGTSEPDHVQDLALAWESIRLVWIERGPDGEELGRTIFEHSRNG